ncbi:acyl-CoA/acyl-ACP dehydrogenase [Flavihumibacter rivuli]|uniref:acyl-CoA dehydrogenase family protein n=1 Tax=Flavihumibacter rivuli TaxID=2838156 RepID=UPI001BDDEFE3|nr:acyl-CoA dehydrogenase family protein [Flavihumibacter rivuli]ULQ54908.1 acyl-CoA/acyl-ACP dehydrogenase [Flavihumibacter rivuli]
MTTITLSDHVAELANTLQSEFSSRTNMHDATNSFVEENYERLKAEKIFSALVPTELGGDGWDYEDMCFFLRELAKGCSSTALALSMHQHLVAANVWKYKKGQGSEELLRKIAANQLVLVSTGAGDWLSSSGTLQKTEGGYLVNGRKNFASQSPIGNILVTSAQYNDPEAGPQVLHFGIPFQSKGVKLEDNWYAMGMRGTGSCSITLEEVFVPEANISLRRPRGEFHPFWNVVLTVALPLIMSTYVGIAEKAYDLSLAQAIKKPESYTPIQLGELFNLITTAQVMLKDMIRITNNFDFKPVDENGNAVLARKSVVANSSIQAVQKAVEIFGGQSYLCKMPIEKLYRDILAAPFHPLPEKEQQTFTGNFLLGNKLLG